MIEFTNHPYPLQILFCPHRRAWRKAAPTLEYGGGPGHGAHTLTIRGQGDWIVVVLDDQARELPPHLLQALLVHEAVHVVRDVGRLIGQRLDSETEAYMVQEVSLFLWGCVLPKLGE